MNATVLSSLLQQGLSNSEIAGVLHVGTETVRTHARSIYRKLGVQNRRELASLAQRRNGELTALGDRAAGRADGR